MDKAFAIIGKLIYEPNSYKMLGTGFFIDNEGFFTTAGHVFRNHRNTVSQFYICFPKDNENVDLIEVVRSEFISLKMYGDHERHLKTLRDRNKFQCGPEYIDVVVGKVELSGTDFYKFQRKRPFATEKLIMPCFNINDTICKNRKFSLINGQVNSQYIEHNNRSFVVKARLKHARIPFLYETMIFRNIDLYNNCIEIFGNGKKGNSGAPILNEKEKVVGMYLTGTRSNDLGAAHLSKYIKKKTMNLRQKIKMNNNNTLLDE